jgi:hypothetical protein
VSGYWQHIAPIECPEGHKMIWLGGAHWICEWCSVLYVIQHNDCELCVGTEFQK